MKAEKHVAKERDVSSGDIDQAVENAGEVLSALGRYAWPDVARPRMGSSYSRVRLKRQGRNEREHQYPAQIDRR